jgi:nucleoside 2-deoxyribosyltransferase
MDRIASTLEQSGFSTFLPHRDGLEFAQLKPALEQCGASPSEAASIVDQAIFTLDTYQLLRRCDVVVGNLNGKMPDCDRYTISKACEPRGNWTQLLVFQHQIAASAP